MSNSPTANCSLKTSQFFLLSLVSRRTISSIMRPFISSSMRSVTRFLSGRDRLRKRSSCMRDLIMVSACEYLIPGCENTVRVSFLLKSVIQRVSISTVRSSKSKYSFISTRCSSRSSTLCSSLFLISNRFLRMSLTLAISMLSKISLGFCLSFLRFLAEMPRSFDLKSLVRTSSVKRWLMSSTIRLMALVSSFLSYNSLSDRKCPSFW